MAASQSNNLSLVKRGSNSVSYIEPLRETLPTSQRNRAVRLLSMRLPYGWVTHSGLKVRKYGKNFGVPNYCTKCGQTVRQLVEHDKLNVGAMSAPQRRTFMFAHVLSDH